MESALIPCKPTETELEFRTLNSALRREFRRAPFGFNKDLGLLTVFAGQGERFHVAPITEDGNVDWEATGYVALPVNAFVIRDRSGSCVRVTQSLGGFVLSGDVVEGSPLADLITSEAAA